jgi:hypothetical protein
MSRKKLRRDRRVEVVSWPGPARALPLNTHAPRIPLIGVNANQLSLRGARQLSGVFVLVSRCGLFLQGTTEESHHSVDDLVGRRFPLLVYASEEGTETFKFVVFLVCHKNYPSCSSRGGGAFWVRDLSCIDAGDGAIGTGSPPF